MWINLPKLMIFLRMRQGFTSYINSSELLKENSPFFIKFNFYLLVLYIRLAKMNPLKLSWTLVMEVMIQVTGVMGIMKKIALNIALKLEKLEKSKDSM